jgi:hypothetical protein
MTSGTIPANRRRFFGPTFSLFGPGPSWSRLTVSSGLSIMLFVNPPRASDRARGLTRRQHLVAAAPPLPLYDGEGLAAVMVAAVERNVTVVI